MNLRGRGEVLLLPHPGVQSTIARFPERPASFVQARLRIDQAGTPSPFPRSLQITGADKRNVPCRHLAFAPSGDLLAGATDRNGVRRLSLAFLPTSCLPAFPGSLSLTCSSSPFLWVAPLSAEGLDRSMCGCALRQRASGRWQESTTTTQELKASIGLLMGCTWPVPATTNPSVSGKSCVMGVCRYFSTDTLTKSTQV